MSDPTENTYGSTGMKAGRPPAIKVGGMRVSASRPRQTSQGDDKDRNITSEETTEDNITTGNNRKSAEYDDDDNDEHESRTVANHIAGQMVSGTFVPVQKAYPTEGVKHMHNKPGTYPKHESHSHVNMNDQRFINQPRK